MTVRYLPQTTINRIAAGEVIERPASVVKELVENAIDAGASSLEIVVADGGLSLIRVIDNGSGMSEDDLALSVERHATSKLQDDELLAISTLGFRGEALPSIGSIAKLTIQSRSLGADQGFEISVDGGVKSEVKPVALNEGTVVEVRDLFYATPARLKFQKSERAEHSAISDVIKRLSLAHPDISIRFLSGERLPLTLPAVAIGDKEGELNRIAKIMGAVFAQDALEIDATRDEFHLHGFASLATLHRANSLMQFFFVNGRPVRDKQILGAIKGAYSDFLPSSRYPMVCLFLDMPASEVDVNVHPAKSDVRFQDPQKVRGLIVGALKQALSQAGHLASSEGGRAAFEAMTVEGENVHGLLQSAQGYAAGGSGVPLYSGQGGAPAFHDDGKPSGVRSALIHNQSQAPIEGLDELSGAIVDNEADDEAEFTSKPLGAAKAHFFENYIVAQTDDGMVIVDAHAAHERIVYEQLKTRIKEGHVPSQGLLIPEIVDLDEKRRDGLLAHAEGLQAFGLYVESFGPGSISVQEVPALISNCDMKALINDLADEIVEMDETQELKARLDYVCATMACHGSVRSGRRLKGEEMNSLLRQMEATPHSGQCNHGRPTYIELKLKDIERLFGR